MKVMLRYMFSLLFVSIFTISAHAQFVEQGPKRNKTAEKGSAEIHFCRADCPDRAGRSYCPISGSFSVVDNKKIEILRIGLEGEEYSVMFENNSGSDVTVECRAICMFRLAFRGNRCSTFGDVYQP